LLLQIQLVPLQNGDPSEYKLGPDGALIAGLDELLTGKRVTTIVRVSHISLFHPHIWETTPSLDHCLSLPRAPPH
jgi:hypothetical protein